MTSTTFMSVHLIGPEATVRPAMKALRQQVRAHLEPTLGDWMWPVRKKAARLGLGEGLTMTVAIEGGPSAALLAVLTAPTPSGQQRLAVGYTNDATDLFGVFAHPAGGFRRSLRLDSVQKAVTAAGRESLQEQAANGVLDDVLTQVFAQTPAVQPHLQAVAPAPTAVARASRRPRGPGR
jgi:hypothetical protein